jgi:hypothetical protein
MPAGETEKSPDVDVPMERFIWCTSLFGIGSLAISVVHALFPERFDLISVVVAEVAIAPILVFLFRNLELGFGEWKVGLTPNRVQAAFERVDSLTERLAPAQLVAKSGAADIQVSFLARHRADQIDDLREANKLEMADDDVVFVRLRRELERRLKRIADSYGLPNVARRSPAQLLRALEERKIIGEGEARGIAELIAAGNAQAHGSSAAPSLADLARIDGDRLLAALDELAVVPEQEILLEVVAMASNAGKNVELDAVISSGHSSYFVDALIPGELTIEVKQSTTIAAVRAGFMFLYEIWRQSKLDGLLVLKSEPTDNVLHKVTMYSADFHIGVAWRVGKRYEGNSLAHELAPWLFTTGPAQHG